MSCSGEDELRKVSVQVRRRSTQGPSLRCITHLLSFFALSFLLKIVLLLLHLLLVLLLLHLLSFFTLSFQLKIVAMVAPITMSRGIFIGQ